MRNTVVQATSLKYGNDSFKIIYTPSHVIAPQIGSIVDADTISRMVSNGYTITILPAEDPDSE